MWFCLKKLLGNGGHGAQLGFFMVETLVMIALFAIIALGFASSAIFGMQMRMRAIHRSVAMELATDIIETTTFVDPATLAAGTTNTGCVWTPKPALKFTCILVVTDNADGSKAVTVTVTDLNSKMAGSVSLTTTLAGWGSA